MRLRFPVLLLTPLLALPMVLLGAGSAAAGVEDDVASAQQEVAGLSADLGRTAEELTAGTLRYQQGQEQLAATQARAAQVRAEADAALARAAQAKATLAEFVNASYRTPLPDPVSSVLNALPGQLGQAVLAEAELNHVRGNQQDALKAATEAQAAAEELSRQADGLAADAVAQAADLAAQVAALQAEAAASQARLEAAAQRLRVAEAARQSALDQAAAEAAAQKALIDVSGGLALCTGVDGTGYPNGFLPPEALCPLAVGNGHRLRADAAAAFNRLFAAHPICVTDSYRSYGQQVDVYSRKPDLAAVPGTSNHGLGLAVDLCGGIESFGTPEYTWMKANAPAYGFVHPAWAEPGGGRPEPWHWEYQG